ncbi:hypothetical protein RSAG8_13393, partial [Rhizoctonia solani AG-8 WAC10335]
MSLKPLDEEALGQRFEALPEIYDHRAAASNRLESAEFKHPLRIHPESYTRIHRAANKGTFSLQFPLVVSFVGVVSNLALLCYKYTWMQLFCNLPDVIVGITNGILPCITLAILMISRPIILRLFARFVGILKFTSPELSLMTRYFIFPVVHLFHIVTISSRITAALPQLASNPTNVSIILAENLPEASTPFLTYAILHRLAGSAGGLLQVVPLVLYHVKLYILGSTPRSIYKTKYLLCNVAWGTIFPLMALITIIGLAYSIASPLINCLIFFVFFLFYQYGNTYACGSLDNPRLAIPGDCSSPKPCKTSLSVCISSKSTFVR